MSLSLGTPRFRLHEHASCQSELRSPSYKIEEQTSILEKHFLKPSSCLLETNPRVGEPPRLCVATVVSRLEQCGGLGISPFWHCEQRVAAGRTPEEADLSPASEMNLRWPCFIFYKHHHCSLVPRMGVRVCEARVLLLSYIISPPLIHYEESIFSLLKSLHADASTRFVLSKFSHHSP